MSIIQYKSTELVATTRKGKSVTLVIEDDKYEIYFPNPIWDAIKLYAGIYRDYPSGFEALMLRTDRRILWQEILLEDELTSSTANTRWRSMPQEQLVSVCWKLIRRNTRPDIYTEYNHLLRVLNEECELCDQKISGSYTKVASDIPDQMERSVHQKCLLNYKRCITCDKEDVPLKKKSGWVGLKKFFHTKNPIMFAWTCADCESEFINGYCEDCSTDVPYKDLKFVAQTFNYYSRVCCKDTKQCHRNDNPHLTEEEIIASFRK